MMEISDESSSRYSKESSLRPSDDGVSIGINSRESIGGNRLSESYFAMAADAQ